jgi:outer membrane protein
MNPKQLISAAALATITALPGAAQEAGTILFGFGLHVVDPSSASTTAAGKVKADESIRPTITAEYFFRDNLGVEILAALPFKHDVKVGGQQFGTVKQLPPVVSLQYHFANHTRVTPFVGLGVNFTTFFDEETDSGLDLSLDNSWGLAAHIGADIAINEKSWLRIDARWIDIDTDAHVETLGNIGEVEVDPIVYGLAYVWKF